MKKFTYISAFCCGIVLTSLYNYIFPIKSVSAENPGKQDLLYSIAYNLAKSCNGAYWGELTNSDRSKQCLDGYTYYAKLGGTNELIFYAREQYNKDKQSK